MQDIRAWTSSIGPQEHKGYAVKTLIVINKNEIALNATA